MPDCNRACIHSDQRDCHSFPGKAFPGTPADHDLLYHPWNGPAYHSNILHYGIHLRADPFQDECTAAGCALLCILLRNCSGYYTAGCAGSICGFCYFRGKPHEDRCERDTPCHRRIYHSVHLCSQPRYASDKYHMAGSTPDYGNICYRNVRSYFRAERIQFL